MDNERCHFSLATRSGNFPIVYCLICCFGQVTMWASGGTNENDDISVIEESCVEVDPDFSEYMQSSHGSTAATPGTILTANVPIQASSSGLGLTLATGVDLSDPKQLAELAKSKIQRVKPQVCASNIIGKVIKNQYLI